MHAIYTVHVPVHIIIHLTCTICTVHGLVNIQVLCIIYTCSWIDVCRLCYGTRVTVVCASVCSQSTDFLNMEVGLKVTYTLYMRHKAYVHVSARRSCQKLEFKKVEGGGGPGQVKVHHYGDVFQKVAILPPCHRTCSLTFRRFTVCIIQLVSGQHMLGEACGSIEWLLHMLCIEPYFTLYNTCDHCHTKLACQPMSVVSIIACSCIYVPEKDKMLPLCATLRTVSASTRTQGLHVIEV